jgi:hydroxyethylthiazole kinase-like uncharacterized protein yjeF
MSEFDVNDLKKLYIPPVGSNKGENGKLMVIAGSILFHAAGIWPLEVASKIVDMVYFSSVTMNNDIVQKDKDSFRNGIVVPRENIDNYIKEADCVLIGPGLPRDDGRETEEESTKELTERLLTKFPDKRWVIDGGSLQAVGPEILPQNSIITPNKKEFEMLKLKITDGELRIMLQKLLIHEQVFEFAKRFKCIVLLKGEMDYLSDGISLIQITGGNVGMIKGGTGDCLAGLLASLYCKNDAFLSATSASYINKKAGESLAQRQGIYFNATNLADEIPIVMKNLLTS